MVVVLQPRSLIKLKFAAASKAAVEEYGWKALFAQYDLDGSGTMDMVPHIASPPARPKGAQCKHISTPTPPPRHMHSSKKGAPLRSMPRC